MDLIGERVRLRRSRPEDADVEAPIFALPEVARFTGRHLLLPQSAARLREVNSDQSGRLAWTVTSREDGSVLGDTTLFRFNHLDRHCWFAITLGPPERLGKGLGTETTILVTRFAFRQLGMEKVCLAVFEGNERAIAAYRKAGYEVEATLRRHHLLEGQLVVEYWMAAFRDHPLYG